MKRFFAKSVLTTTALLLVLSVSAIEVGQIDFNFNSPGNLEGWTCVKAAANTNETSTFNVSNGMFNIVYGNVHGTLNYWRMDFSLGTVANPIELVLHAGTYPIIAIRIKNKPTQTFRLHSSAGNFAGSSAAQLVTGSYQDAEPGFEVLYYDLTAHATSFGTTKFSTTDPTTVAYLNFVCTQPTSSGFTSHSFDWVKTFGSVEELEEFIGYTPSSVKNNNGVDLFVSAAKGTVQIENCPLNATVSIFDLAGKAVFQGISSSSHLSLLLSQGAYIVRIVDDESTYSNKIVVR